MQNKNAIKKKGPKKDKKDRNKNKQKICATKKCKTRARCKVKAQKKAKARVRDKKKEQKATPVGMVLKRREHIVAGRPALPVLVHPGLEQYVCGGGKDEEKKCKKI